MIHLSLYSVYFTRECTHTLTHPRTYLNPSSHIAPRHGFRRGATPHYRRVLMPRPLVHTTKLRRRLHLQDAGQARKHFRTFLPFYLRRYRQRPPHTGNTQHAHWPDPLPAHYYDPPLPLSLPPPRCLWHTRPLPSLTHALLSRVKWPSYGSSSIRAARRTRTSP